MADTPEAESQEGQTSEQTEYLPSEALYMDGETALHRAKALFRAICELAGQIEGNSATIITDLASLGEAIMEDQLH